jgi:hypothetical protein
MIQKAFLVVLAMHWLQVGAQGPLLNGALVPDGLSSHQVLCMDRSGNGDLVTGGTFTGMLDFDPGLGVNMQTASSTASFVWRIDSIGNPYWVTAFDCTLNSRINDIAFAPNGDIWAVGQFQGMLSYSLPTGKDSLISIGLSDGFLVHLDPIGTILWVGRMGGNSTVFLESIGIDSMGRIYYTGNFTGTADLNPSVDSTLNFTSAGLNDFFLGRLDSVGQFLGAWKLGGPLNDMVEDLQVNSLGVSFLTGHFQGTVDLDPLNSVQWHTTHVNSTQDAFLMAVDSSGSLLWSRSFGSGLPDFGRAMALDADGSLYLAGDFRLSMNFTPGSQSNFIYAGNGGSCFVSKWGSDGSFKWGRSYAADFLAKVQSISALGNSVLVGGQFGQTTDFEPGNASVLLTSQGLTDGYLLGLTNNGTFQFAFQSGGTGEMNLHAMVHANPPYAYIAGNFFEQEDLVLGIGTYVQTASPFINGFVSRFEVCTPPEDSIAIVSCGPFLAPGQSVPWSVSGLYQYNQPNPNQCDSLITVFLSVIPFDTSVTSTGISLKAKEGNATYQWLDCLNGMAPVIGGTGQTFVPGAQGIFAVEITKGNCVDTSSCHSLMSIALEEGQQQKLEFYPNPSVGTGTIVSPFPGDAQARLYNAMGQVHMQMAIPPGISQFSFPFPAGVYQLEIEFENQRQVHRWIIAP